MTEEECLRIAEAYLSSYTIEHTRPSRIQRKENARWEAAFLIPKASDPSVAAIDPPDVRVWLTLQNGEVEWIHQM
ncbi:hypothetical protein ACN9MZ_23125 [Pseudoduganella sp. S-14]|jgi:hypothetical protein|uniref:hypothetical protein n=1 Tax=Pseudoduganella sp. S-14 TaxID=3404065 RepID=UPI003CF03E9F